jgi:hypothetical protein
MNFNKHSNLIGEHAFLSASKYHWINYDEDKLLQTYLNYLASEKGTRLHELAKEHIELGIKMPNTKKTLNMYINDAIGYKMKPEQVLYYSDNCFGTADAISFRKNLLRIHDLKTGKIPASMNQLLIYTALFCLEYDVKPADIDVELRIYQNDQVLVHNPKVDEVAPIMSKIISFSRYIDKIKNMEE